MEESVWKRWTLGFVLLLVPFLLFALLIGAWPVKTTVDGVETIVGTWAWLNDVLGSNPEVRLLLIVMIAGAVGSSIHAAKAFAFFVGSNTFGISWLWWYALRFPTGIGLALLMYLVIRGGLFAGSFADQSAAVDAVNPFGFAALAALTGMFSSQASDKLEEIFEGIFRTDQKPAANSPTLVGSLPTVKVGASGKDLKIAIATKNVAEGATATVGGQQRTISSTSEKGFTLDLKDEDVREAKSLDVKVTNAADKGGKSLAFKIQVVAAASPTAEKPAITPVPVPPAIGATGAALDITVKGLHFVDGAAGRINGVDRVTAFTSATELTVTLIDEDVANAGSLTLTIRNPDGTESAPVTLTIE